MLRSVSSRGAALLTHLPLCPPAISGTRRLRRTPPGFSPAAARHRTSDRGPGNPEGASRVWMWICEAASPVKAIFGAGCDCVLVMCAVQEDLERQSYALKQSMRRCPDSRAGRDAYLQHTERDAIIEGDLRLVCTQHLCRPPTTSSPSMSGGTHECKYDFDHLQWQ